MPGAAKAQASLRNVFTLDDFVSLRRVTQARAEVHSHAHVAAPVYAPPVRIQHPGRNVLGTCSCRSDVDRRCGFHRERRSRHQRGRLEHGSGASQQRRALLNARCVQAAQGRCCGPRRVPRSGGGRIEVSKNWRAKRGTCSGGRGRRPRKSWFEGLFHQESRRVGIVLRRACVGKGSGFVLAPLSKALTRRSAHSSAVRFR